MTAVMSIIQCRFLYVQEAKPTDITKMDELLTKLRTKPNSAMYKFYEVLRDQDEALADSLYTKLAAINRAPPSASTSPAAKQSAQPSSVGPGGDHADDDLPESETTDRDAILR